MKDDKEYKYHINVSSNIVRAEIYYETKGAYKGSVNEIYACHKSYGNIFSFKSYPSEENLRKAQEWAQEQCKLMNEIQ